MTDWNILRAAVRRIANLSALTDGWNYGRGRAPSQAAQINATSLALLAAKAAAEMYEVFPEDEGGILLIAYRPGESFEMLARVDGKFEIAFEDDSGLSPAKDLASIQDVAKELEQRGWQLRKSYDSFIRLISVSERSGTRPLHSDPNLPGFQLSTPIAFKPMDVTAAPTLNFSIPDGFGAHPQSSGGSRQRSLARTAG
jgi:hypothetical protein